MLLDKEYWNTRYKTDDFGWDAGEITAPLKNYFDLLTNLSLKILIPGGGNSYEAEYLFKKGFENVHVLDFAEEPLKNIKARCKSFPTTHLIKDDFFNHKGQYDLIIEQTFFCALNPELRGAYAKHMHELLKPKGKLVGVLFDDVLNNDKPPFGGNTEEYVSYFMPYFKFKVFEASYNSIKPREGRELFIHFEKK